MRYFAIFRTTLLPFAVTLLLSCANAPRSNVPAQDQSKIHFEGEKHLKNLRQLTYGGTNAEAYWSFDGQWLTFQAKGGGIQGLANSKPDCDQIYRMRADGSDAELVSTLGGRTTCSFYLPNDKRILYSSTHASESGCPTEPDRSKGYVWPIYNTYQMYSADPKHPDAVLPLEPGAPRAYNAEAVTCKDGSVVFTSDRDGDLELYVGKLDALGTLGNIKRVTKTPGYDGGAFFSQDCSKLVWRASRPKAGPELQEYQDLLKQHLVRPSKLEIWTANADGSNAHQVTKLAAASFAPYFTPKADRILFSSNFEDPKGRSFAIYSIRTNGTGLERITYSGTFDGFPMFSPDGTKLAFSSNRNGSKPRETNVFVADWVETPDTEVSQDSKVPAERYLGTIKKLAAPEWGGRGIGTPEMVQVEDYVSGLFAETGLKPFFETFPLTAIKPVAHGTPGKLPSGSGFKQAIEIRALEPSHDAPVTQKTSATAVQLIPGHNILGTLGDGCSKHKPLVIVGAHLDHLGLGGSSSLSPTKTGIHHGADDNASGVAAILESARLLKEKLATNSKALKNACFVFAAFTGEETGVAGSARAAEMLQVMKLPIKAMLNLDMVGRLRNNQLIIFGTDSAAEWKSWVSETCDALSLTCPGGGDGYGPSDHMPFYAKGAPVLHFFTGPHADYHRPSDTWDKINATGGLQVAQAVTELAMKAAQSPRAMTYQKPSSAPMMLTSSDGSTVTPGQQARSSGAFLGTIPDYAQMTSPSGPGGDSSNQGVLLSGARSGSPAEKAGVQSGDILFSIFNEVSKSKTDILSLKDFMTSLRTLKPGDKIVLGIRRTGQVLNLPAVVGTRSAE